MTCKLFFKTYPRAENLSYFKSYLIHTGTMVSRTERIMWVGLVLWCRLVGSLYQGHH